MTGRPPLDVRRDVSVKVFFTPGELEDVRRAADAQGMSMSQWLRALAIRMLREEELG